MNETKAGVAMSIQCRGALDQIRVDTDEADAWVWSNSPDWHATRALFNKMRQEAERVVDDLDRNMNSLEAQQ